MELTPETLHAAEFREARRGGYNTRDVDDFIEEVAAGVALLRERLREAMVRAEAGERRMAEMQRQLEEMQRRAPAAPAAPSAPAVSETDDTLRRTLVLAQRTADATIKEAKDEAARLLSEAREEAARIRSELEADARRGTEGARQAAEAEVQQLRQTRDTLRRDVEALNQGMNEQRERVRTGVAELQRLLDDPKALHPTPPPRLSEPEPAAPAGGEAAGATPARDPLPMRKPRTDEGQIRNGNGAPDAGAPSAPGSGAQVAALQEPPPPQPRPAGDDTAPQPVPFAFTGGGNGATEMAWPPQLHTSPGDPGPTAPSPAAQEPPDPALGGIGIEPGRRPSEWGKPVFDRAKEADVAPDEEPDTRFIR